MKYSNKLHGFEKYFYAIILPNQMFVGLVHYDSKAFMKGYEREWSMLYEEMCVLNLFNGRYA